MAKSQSNIPAWVWLFTGVVTGLFLAFLYYLAGIKPSAEQMKQVEMKKPSITSTGKGAPKFDFYTLLPDKEVVQPDATQKPAKTATKTTDKPEQFLIQTGSFRDPQEADKRKAELILLGLDVKVQNVDLKDGETWHRVQIGPFNSEAKLDAAKAALAENHIEYIVLKLK